MVSLICLWRKEAVNLPRCSRLMAIAEMNEQEGPFNAMNKSGLTPVMFPAVEIRRNVLLERLPDNSSRFLCYGRVICVYIL